MSDTQHDDWIPVAEAVRLLPSCRPGKKVALSTIYRWVEQGLLDEMRVGRWKYVRRGQVLARMRPTRRAAPARPADDAAIAERQREWEAETARLRVKHGI